MTVEKQALYESILTALQVLEERAVGNNDKITDVRLGLARQIAASDKRFSTYEGMAKGFSLAFKVVGAACVSLAGAVLAMAIYILKANGVL